MTITTVRQARADDETAWAELYRGYREFYELAPDDAVVARVGSWTPDPAHETGALVAVAGDGSLVGLAHYRRFARPSSGTTGLYLDDLFTTPQSRGAGVGRVLIDGVSAIAATEGLSVVRWIPNENNTTARRLYDAVATATPWVTYDRAPA
jgi:GNAT superfamily N-acetyltransferase